MKVTVTLIALGLVGLRTCVKIITVVPMNMTYAS